MRQFAVLVVEHDPLLLLNALEIVGDAGFHAYGVRTTEDAIFIMEQHDDIRVLFVDADMPGSAVGLELAHAIRKRWPPVTIIVTSGDADMALRDLPASGVLIPKPYHPADVAAALTKTMLI